MGDTAEFTIGAEVACNDGACGNLTRVVVDPIARVVTHLVVKANQRQSTGHLVPIELVDTTDRQIRLRCTQANFEALEDAEETHFLPGASGPWGYGQDQMLSHPYFGLGMGMGGMGLGGMGMGGGLGGMGLGGMGMGGMQTPPQAVTYDKVPAGEVEVHRGDRVHATDGPIGRVRGLVIDADDHQVTHVLLDEGHLWGKKEVAIPISAVTGVGEDGARLNLTKDEVRDLPSVDIDHPE
jgi:sporulation protein YlmC with PRC-barrel domain